MTVQRRWFILAAAFLASGISGAGAAPMPSVEPHLPCAAGDRPFPAYPAVADAEPATYIWSPRDLGDGRWPPPDCLAWGSDPTFKLLVAVAGRFRFNGRAEDLAVRFGGISTLLDIRYWSVHDKEWLPLVTAAVALDGPDPQRTRRDFAASDIGPGADLYYAQTDNRSARAVIYRLHVTEIGPDRLSIEAMNVTPVRYSVLTLFEPGALRTAYFLTRLGPDNWGYYSLTRTGAGTSSFAGGHAPSYVNRAVAFYRHVVGIPTDREPPAAP